MPSQGSHDRQPQTKRKQRKLQSPTPGSKLQRMLLGGFCLVFLIAGSLVRWIPAIDGNSGVFASGALLKVGVVLGIAWLAAPQLERLGWQRVKGTMLIGIVIILALFAIRPKIGAIAGVVFVAGSVFFSVAGWLRTLAKFSGSDRKR
jgi:hypothetical protein